MVDKAYCDQHQDLSKNQNKILTEIAILNSSFKDVKEKILLHINEGEKIGGFRDRVHELEYKTRNLDKEISVIKKGYWKACIVSGLIGGLISQSTPEFFKFIIKLFIGI